MRRQPYARKVAGVTCRRAAGRRMFARCLPYTVILRRSAASRAGRPGMRSASRKNMPENDNS
ncbi:hypothetical protein CEY11_17490 [Candidimonas nitroreducens]|uniref:Uncharacterized protein n=1 Tax=Candidimonas nitroreducens TaxID=683354 RepID=A0A225M7K0_9BURK|nr:hypothetical protein CEY11_17490 [Candidimonas nitroreducens]